MCSDHPNQVDVKSKVGSLVVADARVLHAAYKNQTDQRRNLLLLWHNRPEATPDYWQDEILQEIQDSDPQATYPGTRIPGQYLQA